LRERWFGATRVRVPEIAVEGEAEFPAEPLVLDDVSDVERLRASFEEGTPIVVRADSAEQVVAALERPEVACVLVPPERRELLDLDLVELTYGT
jgi:hypothetical protein